ncbi:transcription initiation factor IIB [Coemansia sp. RSA 2611]|nr:transcription initiation factor IIB [Coemansia sp. RSA 2705]KAJ2317119.1 transcription initiation factor IIB [Coemansia sp. RSA 2704]KAJ2361896.1 transcription initiation factor IIB [Coemansia sp. RSA 2611]
MAPTELATSQTVVAPVYSKPASAERTVICPDCRGMAPKLIHDFASGDLLCGGCNTAVGDRLIGSHSAWRSAMKHSRQAEEDARILMSLQTASPRSDDTISSFGRGDGDSGGSSPVSLEKGAILSRALRSRTHDRVAAQRHERQERNLMRAFGEISAACTTMDLPPVINSTARDLFKRVEAENLHRGKNIDAIIATCIFLACRQKSLPRTFKEICALTKVPRKDIGRTFKFLKEKLGAEASPMSSDDLMTRFCANLSLLSSAQECAVMLNQMAKQRDTLAGKSPVSIAGACIYMASHLVGQPRDAKVISHVAGVSEVTIKNSYKLLFADRYQLVSDAILGTSPMASLEYLPVP